MKHCKNAANPAPVAPPSLAAFVLDDSEVDETANGQCATIYGPNKPVPFRASLSIVADVVPFELCRVNGRWCLGLGLGREYPISGPVLAVEVGEGCALSMEAAARILVGN